MSTPIEAWREAIREKREADERAWAELNQAVHNLAAKLRWNEREEAVGFARRALQIEQELTGNCDATDALCQDLGITIEETES